MRRSSVSPGPFQVSTFPGAQAAGPQPALSTAAFHPESDTGAQAESAMPSVSVIVKSTPPGCDINVDGKYMGSTPSTIQLTPGEHLVSVEKENLTPWQRTMTVTAGGNSTIDATLVKP